MAPAGISRALLARLNTITNRILKDPDVREQLSRQGADPLGGSPEEFAVIISKDTERWKKVVAAGGIKGEGHAKSSCLLQNHRDEPMASARYWPWVTRPHARPIRGAFLPE